MDFPAGEAKFRPIRKRRRERPLVRPRMRGNLTERRADAAFHASAAQQEVGTARFVQLEVLEAKVLVVPLTARLNVNGGGC